MGGGKIFRNLNLYSEFYFRANRTIMDEIQVAGHVQEHRKSSIFMIFDQNQWKSMKIIENAARPAGTLEVMLVGIPFIGK